jgi:hypothetical protein
VEVQDIQDAERMGWTVKRDSTQEYAGRHNLQKQMGMTHSEQNDSFYGIYQRKILLSPGVVAATRVRQTSNADVNSAQCGPFAMSSTQAQQSRGWTALVALVILFPSETKRITKL